MTHQTQLEKEKYRHWVKGALSMKYLRDGLKKFTNDVVQNEHRRILQQIGNMTGLTCTGCSLRDLKPVHTSLYDSTTKRKSCPRGQNNCNCLYPNKTSCHKNICGAIYEEILNTHAYSPPSPCMENTDITKWATHPWEIAKCFINAPGYKDKQSVEEIDLAGLLHVFINNTMFQTSLSCLISGDKRDAFCKVLNLRNKIFHSPNMELEEQDLSECFRNIVIILEDEKNLKQTQCAKEAVKLIKDLENQDFIITTETEAMIVRGITEQRFNKLEESDIELAKGQSKLKDKQNKMEHRQSDLEQKHLELAEGHLELQKKHNELEKRLEQKHTELDQRLALAERELKAFKLHKNKLLIVEKRLDARRKLADHLKKHYVKTSASPLKTRQNEIDIDKVYVQPKIEIVKNDSSENMKNKDLVDGKQIREIPTFVETYSSIFHSHGKRLQRIYLLGEVGSGKSAFCKMMILNWCRSVTQQTDQAICKEELENIETMKKFDFLFFLPLRRLQGNGRIKEMIHWYYKDLIPIEILDDILLNVPEKCVILADGLDEWAPNHDKQRPLHVTDGLPYLEDLEEVTVLTASRPSAPGVLNMAFTESDHKLVVKGIHSIELMAEKYILLLNCPKRDSECILDRLSSIEIGQLEKSPLLLQQLIWMLGNGVGVGKCMSNVYSSLVNIALRWAEEKGCKKKIKNVSFCINSSELHLPKQLLKYDACRANCKILFTIGKIAFELLVPENKYDSQVSFGRGKLNDDGLDDEIIDTLLSIGLLTEDNCHDNIEHRTQFAFAHVSFQEYFAALYIASRSKTDQNRFPHAPERIARELLKRLFGRFCSVQNILQFGVVLQMLCGLAPEMIHDVCEHVYRIAQHDSTYSSLRDTFLLKHSIEWFSDKYISITQDMQKLITNFILENNCNAETSLQVSTLPILDLAIMASERNQYSELFRYIIPQKVLHLSLYRKCSSFITDIVFHNLQTFAIGWCSHADFNLFKAEVNQHLLKTLFVRKCKIISSIENQKGLSAIEIRRPVAHSSFQPPISSVASQKGLSAPFLQLLIAPSGLSFYSNERVFDLSGHHQLELLNTNCCYVENVDLTNIEVIIFSYINISPIMKGCIAPKLRYLEVCGVTMLKSELVEFAKFISRNVVINVLKLNRISYIENYKPSTVNLIDLSFHDNLQVLNVVKIDLISITCVNTTNLHTVTTDRMDVLHAVRNAQKLLHLECCGFVLYTKEMNDDVCSCSQLHKIKIECVTIQDEALEISCAMRNLKCIALYRVMMSLPSWIRFVNSLLSLKQSVTVCFNLGDNFEEVVNYITRNNKKYNLKRDGRPWYIEIEFDTLP